MILSFRGKALEDLYHGRNTGRARRSPRLGKSLTDVLDILNVAKRPEDLASPPGLRYGPVKGSGDRFQVRVNKQWRLEFEWMGTDVNRVELRESLTS